MSKTPPPSKLLTPPVPPPVPSDPATLMPIRNRLVRTIFKISEHAPTSMRAVLDNFGRHLSPSAAKLGAAQFTYNPRPHHRDPRRTLHTTKPGILLGLIGIATTAYYDAVLMGGTPGSSYVAFFEQLVETVEEIEAFGLDAFEAVGSDLYGYTLKLRPSNKVGE